MEEKPDPRPEPDETVVKKPDEAVEDKDLADVSGGYVKRTQLSGPYNDYSGGTYTASGDPSR